MFRTLYEFYARINGVIVWTCPNCYHANKTRKPYTQNRICCSNRECRKWYAIGLRFHELAGGQASKFPPGDTLIPPELVLDKWRNQLPVHALTRDSAL